MNTNEVIANLALERMGLPKGRYDVVHPNDHVNKSQSTNDAYPTGLRIALHQAVDRLKLQLEHLITSLTRKGHEFSDVLKMGRTQLQDAVPMTLGQEFAAFAALLTEELVNLSRNQSLLLEVNLGATAIGTGLNTPPGYTVRAVAHLAEASGLPVVRSENLIEATSDSGAYVSMHAALKRVAVKVGKICNDPTVTPPADAAQLQLNVMEPVIASTTFASIALLARACDTLDRRCVAGITANPEVSERNVMNSIGLVTFLNPIIGHHNGDLVGREAARTGRDVREIVLEWGLLTEEEIDDVLSPANLMRPRYRGAYYREDPVVIAPTADDSGDDSAESADGELEEPAEG